MGRGNGRPDIVPIDIAVASQKVADMQNIEDTVAVYLVPSSIMGARAILKYF